MEGYRCQKQFEEANDIIASLENRMRRSLAKRKELALQLSESNETIDELSGSSGSDEVEEVVSELMERNQILTDQISNLKREQEDNALRMTELIEKKRKAEDERNTTVKSLTASERARNLAEEAIGANDRHSATSRRHANCHSRKRQHAKGLA